MRSRRGSAMELRDDKVVVTFTDVLADLVTRFKTRIDATADTDPVTQDLFIAIAHDLQKQQWMFAAQRQ
ncbi:hypothetical protein AB0J35_58860 [Nonomuraea angiospora]|uniref:hypothetical protein n=1 Tax=Nonomuraea angiospora TaxID=46172 RepID=UPI003420EF01